MSNKTFKKEYIILIALIIVLLLYLVLKRTDRIHYDLPELTPIDVSTLTRIEIIKPDGTITLVKKDTGWLIDPKGYPTDENKITSITDVVKNLQLTELASRSKNYTLYDLGEDKLIRVKAYQGDRVVREFSIGKTTPTNNHTFVKLEENDNVYNAAQAFRRHFETKPGDLRDKVVMKLDKNEISEIELTGKENEKFLFTKTAKPVEKPTEKPAEPSNDKKDEKAEVKDTTEPPAESIWAMADGKEGNKSELDSLLNQLDDLKCDEFIEDKTVDDFKDPIFTIRLKGKKDYTLSIYEKFEKKAEGSESSVEVYPVVSSENPYPFTLGKYAADRLMKKKEDLLKK
jgi:hypothetical protein